uniref:Uncharacterized protein n=1 Tax=Oryza rufipogon TaxID=4529 RepID=A0A0E0R0H8_ORYRU
MGPREGSMLMGGGGALPSGGRGGGGGPASQIRPLPALTLPGKGTVTRGGGNGDSVFRTPPAAGYGINRRRPPWSEMGRSGRCDGDAAPSCSSSHTRSRSSDDGDDNELLILSSIGFCIDI